jgi:hypothetical protein
LEKARSDLKAVLEEVLQVQLSESDFESAGTIESLSETVAARLRSTPNTIGPDVVRAFLDLRRATASVVHVPKASLLPSTPWQMVLPEANVDRRRAWKAIQKAAHASLPGLGWPTWPWMAADIVVWTLGPLAYVALGASLTGILAGVLLLGLALIVTAAIGRAAGAELPHATFADSARHVATERWMPSALGSGSWSPAEVTIVVREFVEAETGRRDGDGSQSQMSKS